MSLRLLHVVVPDDRSDRLDEVIASCREEHDRLQSLEHHAADGRTTSLLLVPTEYCESVTDRIEDAVGGGENFRIVVQKVEATTPLIENETEKEPEASKPEVTIGRVSRAEIVDDVQQMVALTHVFVVYVVLSAVVSAVGLYRGDIAVLVGAMVIAPLLGPNMALAVATSLGDLELGRKALRINAAGVGIAFVLAVFVGLVFGCDPQAPEIDKRIGVMASDLVLALAAGGAGAFAVTSGAPASLVGVMVAVALMPPLVAAGALIGSGAMGDGLQALHLVAVNVICVNLAAVMVFRFQGLRPRAWWQKARAQRAGRLALVIWSVLLALLSVLMFVV